MICPLNGNRVAVNKNTNHNSPNRAVEWNKKAIMDNTIYGLTLLSIIYVAAKMIKDIDIY